MERVVVSWSGGKDASLALATVREYRASHLEGRAVEGAWPLWGRDTDELAASFVDRGFRARIACVDGDALDASFAGRSFDHDLLADLPDDGTGDSRES